MFIEKQHMSIHASAADLLITLGGHFDISAYFVHFLELPLPK